MKRFRNYEVADYIAWSLIAVLVVLYVMLCLGYS